MEIDWYQHGIGVNHQDAIAYEQSSRSQQWGDGLPEGEAERLFSILKSCRSIAWSFGLDKNCQIRWAADMNRAAGRAGFKNAPESFDEPYIHLDQNLMGLNLTDSEILDVYCGVVLHEASHIQFSREAYRVSGQLSRIENLFRGLWEDEFVEQQIRRQRPGYACYLHASKKLLIRDPLEEIRWDALPDLDRLNLIYFLFMRAPDMISTEWQQFKPLGAQETFFEKLCQATSNCPAEEMDFQHAYEATQLIWETESSRYPKTVDDYLSFREALTDSSATDQQLDRLKKQYLSNRIDAVLLAEGNAEDTGKRMSDLSSELGWTAAKLLPEDRGWAQKASEDVFELAFNIFDSGNVLFGRNKLRFGIPELIDLDQKINAVSNPVSKSVGERLDAMELQESEAIEQNRLPASVENSLDGEHSDGSIVEWRYPSRESDVCNRYREVRNTVRNHSKAIAAAIPKLNTGQMVDIAGKRNGRLDRRSLHRFSFDENLFSQRSYGKRRDRRIALGLLLDESASMISVEGLCRRLGIEAPQKFIGLPSKEHAALEIAALFCESLGKRTDLELEIYSHNTDSDKRCILKYLFGRKQREPDLIGYYEPSGSNFDGLAISSAVERLCLETTVDRKLLIVVSDGAPSDAGGIEKARQVVEKSRQSGVEVMGIAIEAYQAEAIYGSANTLVFNDLNTLVIDFKRLLRRLFR